MKGIFIDYEWPIGLFGLYCAGTENTIWECVYYANDTGQECSQTSDASVFCMRKHNTTTSALIMYFAFN